MHICWFVPSIEDTNIFKNLSRRHLCTVVSPSASITLFIFFLDIKGDQASIIGGVIEFIKELHQVLQSLESKKQRKSLSPSPGPSPRPVALQLNTSTSSSSSQPDIPFGLDNFKELAASCNSSVADVEAKISGSNVILRIISRRIPGQILKVINVLEKLSFEVLHLNISSMEETVLYSFVIKVRIYVCISYIITWAFLQTILISKHQLHSHLSTLVTKLYKSLGFGLGFSGLLSVYLYNIHTRMRKNPDFIFPDRRELDVITFLYKNACSCHDMYFYFFVIIYVSEFTNSWCWFLLFLISL